VAEQEQGFGQGRVAHERKRAEHERLVEELRVLLIGIL
jgi:hypothetical protein